MSVHDALILINREITNFLTPESSSFDADTLFCATWFDQYGWSAGPFGEADTLARAKGTFRGRRPQRRRGRLRRRQSPPAQMGGLPRRLGPQAGSPHARLGSLPSDHPDPENDQRNRSRHAAGQNSGAGRIHPAARLSPLHPLRAQKMGRRSKGLQRADHLLGRHRDHIHRRRTYTISNVSWRRLLGPEEIRL